MKTLVSWTILVLLLVVRVLLIPRHRHRRSHGQIPQIFSQQPVFRDAFSDFRAM